MKEIHHACRCTGQTFTFKEWSAYLKAHPNTGEIVFSTGKFGWNIFDVCMNPNINVKWCAGSYRFEIETAQSPNGRWDNGYSCMFHTSGMSHGVSFVSRPNDGYPSEKDAIYDALCEIEKRCLREIEEAKGRIEYNDAGEPVNTSSIIPKLNKALDQIRKYKEAYDPVQLTLFEL